MVCLRNICINTLHKGDNDDDDDVDDDDDDNNNNNNNNFHIRQNDQQDAPLSHLFIPIKLSYTCFEKTSS
jgi:hypothetical protein